MKGSILNRITHKISLRRKLILTSLGCLVVPGILMLYITSYSSQNIIKEQTFTNAQESLKIVKSNVGNLINNMISVSNSIQFDTEIKLSLLTSTKENMSVRSRIAINEKLEHLATDKLGMNITLLLPDGRYFTNYSFDDYDPLLFTKESWFKELSKLTSFETSFLGLQRNYLKSEQEKDPYVIMTARALRNNSSEAYAILIVSYRESTFNVIFREFIRNQNLFLLDGNKRIISQLDSTMLGENFNEIIKGVNSPDTIRLNGQDQLYVSIPLGSSGWELASIVPYEQATNKLNAIYRSGLWLQIGFFVFFVIILLFLLRQFTKPIVKLGRIADKVEMGILNVRSGISGYDEVGRLGRSFDNMLDRIHQMIEQIQMEQELKRKTELSLLQAQIHPHFLFNFLNSIRMHLILKKDEESAEIIGSLSLLLRATISNSGEFVTLHSEINLSKQYMELMNFTTRHPVELILDLDSDVLLELVPRFILQPLIENAYKHGFAQSGGKIKITAVGSTEELLISVDDNGFGMNSEMLCRLQEKFMLGKLQLLENANQHEQRFEIGLSNIYKRLKMISGDKFKMQVQSELNKGTIITLHIPIANEVERHV